MGILPTTLPASAVLNQQIEIFGETDSGGGVSLDSLWRAAGCPADRDPRQWSKMAAPLIRGLSRYLVNLSASTAAEATAEPPVVLWTWNAPSSEPWRQGDLMSIASLARVYASYLDN